MNGLVSAKFDSQLSRDYFLAIIMQTLEIWRWQARTEDPKPGPGAGSNEWQMSGKSLCVCLSQKTIRQGIRKQPPKRLSWIWSCGPGVWLYFYVSQAEAGSCCYKIWRRICRKCKVLHPKFGLYFQRENPGAPTTVTIGAKLKTRFVDGRLDVDSLKTFQV